MCQFLRTFSRFSLSQSDVEGEGMKPRETINKPRTIETPESKREEENRAAIELDALLKEVGEANARIADPADRERIIPSRPCK